ncbi:MAG: hypothetical protein ACPK85_05760 [Methanosarcina sp.]
MEDIAIKVFNYIIKRQANNYIISTGFTYKIRKNQYYYQDKRVFPSYIQTGHKYLIEKSKRLMITEDLSQAIKIITGQEKASI